jgi:hypothetical protein
MIDFQYHTLKKINWLNNGGENFLHFKRNAWIAALPVRRSLRMRLAFGSKSGMQFLQSFKVKIDPETAHDS